MKKYLFISLFVITLISCTNDNTEFEEKRNNIVGKWEVTQVTQQIRADTVYSESSIGFLIEFFSDGTGMKESLLDTIVTFDWLYQYNPEEVWINTAHQGVIFGDIQYNTVTTNEMDRQIWEFEVDPNNGVVDLYKHTWKLDRIN